MQENEISEKLEKFSKQVLRGEPIPHDLEKMLLMQWTRVEQEGLYVDPLQALQTRLIEPGGTYPLLDHSYLNDKDRANPATMANVKAMSAVIAMCSFVGEDDESRLYGYWHGPKKTPASEAPILLLNSEGQFDLCSGRNLAEALLAAWAFDEETFVQRKDWFAKYGVNIVATSLNDLPTPHSDTLPQELHQKLYREFKAVP